MFKIVRRKQLNGSVVLMDIDAPFIAKKADAGQFVIVRSDEYSERIPLTIADFDREKGTVTIIFQTIGGSTMTLAALNEGDEIKDVVGPLGTATEYEKGIKKVAVVGGGVGCAIAYPQAKKLHNMGVDVQLIAGFRNKDIIILEEEMRKDSTQLHICTDDGSYGYHGFVTDKLKELIDGGADFDLDASVFLLNAEGKCPLQTDGRKWRPRSRGSQGKGQRKG